MAELKAVTTPATNSAQPLVKVATQAQRQNRLIRNISLLLVVASLLIVLYSFVEIFTDGNYGLTLIIGTIGTVFCALAYFLAKIGRARQSSWLLIFILVAGNTLICFTFSPSVVTLLFFLVIAVVALIITKASVAFGVLGWNFVLGSYLTTTHNLTWQAKTAIAANSQFSVLLLIVVIQVIIIGLVVYLRNDLNQTNQSLDLQARQLTDSLSNIEQKRLLGETAGQQTFSLITNLKTTSSQQASSSYQQAASLSQVASFMQEMAQTARTIATKAQDLDKMTTEVKAFTTRVKTAATDVAQVGEKGAIAVERTIESNNRTLEQYNNLLGNMTELKQQQNQIQQVVTSIENISDEINLLSLNAAIEASSAGPYGERFGVVASEVKALSNRVKEASRMIKGTLGVVEICIQKAAKNAETAYQEMQTALVVAQESGLAINELVISIVNNAEEVNAVEQTLGLLSAQTTEINYATSQQSTASTQALVALQEASSTATQIAQGTQEAAGSIADLEQLSQNLRAALVD